MVRQTYSSVGIASAPGMTVLIGCDADRILSADGAIGSKAQAVGGPFDKTGAIGRHFNADGSIGGTIQENLANKK